MESHAEVFRRNFASLEKKESGTRDIRRLATAEAAREIVSMGVTSPEEAARAAEELLGRTDVGVICELARQLSADDGPQEAPKTVSYLRSGTSDKAFSVYEKEFGELKASYCSDFVTCCEDVYYDRSDACILPMEDGVGLIMSIRQMAMRYELKIASVCRVGTGDSTASLALMTSSYTDPEGDFTEVYFDSFHDLTLVELGEICENFGAHIVRINSAVSEHNEKCGYHVKMSVPAENVTHLKFVLDALFPSHVMLGRYRTWELH